MLTLKIKSSDIKATLTKLAENNTEFKRFVSKYDEENPKSSEYKAKVVVAHDTRPSCALLLDAFSCGVADLNGSLQNYGLLTTPQLHYMVRCYNTQLNYGNPTEQGYYQKLSLAFNNIWSLVKLKYFFLNPLITALKKPRNIAFFLFSIE